jgi:Glycine zipper 2TM domain
LIWLRKVQLQTRILSVPAMMLASLGLDGKDQTMRKLISALCALSMATPLAVMPLASAAAHNGAREWRGADGRTYCRKSNGTVGLVVGGAGGALLGRAVDGGRNRATGTILGAAAGALLGREVARKRRCR